MVSGIFGSTPSTGMNAVDANANANVDGGCGGNHSLHPSNPLAHDARSIRSVITGLLSITLDFLVYQAHLVHFLLSALPTHSLRLDDVALSPPLLTTNCSAVPTFTHPPFTISLTSAHSALPLTFRCFYQSGSLLSQQLMQYQQQLQGQGQQRSRTPFGSVAGGAAPEQSPSPAPHQQIPDSSYGGAPGSVGRSSGERWMSGRGGGGGGGGVCSQQGGLDEGVADQGAIGAGGGGSAWGGSNSTRALRRRGSSGSSEFYFVDTQHQQGGTQGSYAQPQPPVR